MWKPIWSSSFYIHMLKDPPTQPIDANDPTDKMLIPEPIDPNDKNEPNENPHAMQKQQSTDAIDSIHAIEYNENTLLNE